MLKECLILALTTCHLYAQDTGTQSYLEKYFFRNGFPTDIGKFLINTGEQFTLVDSLSIPDGRSLQRANADYNKPRVIMAVEDRFDSDIPRSYIGYADKNHSGEMISWNPEQMRYEFLVVENIENDKTPVIKAANRSVCITCHQNEGPIFSRFPWAETSFNANVREKISEEFLKNFFTVSGGFTFDDSVRNSSRALQAAKVCRELCEGDLACQKSLFVVGLINKLPFNADSSANPEIKKLLDNLGVYKNLYKHLTSNKFNYPSSIIPSRDPLTNKSNFFIEAFSKKIVYPNESFMVNPTYDESQSTSSAPNTPAVNSSKLKQEDNRDVNSYLIEGITGLADPRTPRPKVSGLQPEDMNKDVEGIHGVLKKILPVCFGLNADNVNKIIRDGLDQVIMKIFNDPEAEKLFKSVPGKREDFMSFFDKGKNQKNDNDVINCLYQDNASASEDPRFMMLQKINEKLSEEFLAPISVDKKRAVALMKTYCLECHGKETYDENSGIELPLDDLESMKNYQNGKVRQYLKELLMPANFAAKQPSAEERAYMVKALEP